MYSCEQQREVWWQWTELCDLQGNGPVYMIQMCVFVVLCYSPHAIVAQSKNCPFEVNTMFELKFITTTSDNDM